MTTIAAYFNPFDWIPDTWRFPVELELFGFYLTPVIFIFALALLLGFLTAWIGDRLSLARFIWHPPLFLVAIIFIYGFLLSMMFLPR